MELGSDEHSQLSWATKSQLQPPLPTPMATISYFQALAAKINQRRGSMWRPFLRGDWWLKSKRYPSTFAHAVLLSFLSPKSFPPHTWDPLASNSLLRATDHGGPLSGRCVPSLFALCTQVPVPTPCPSSKWLSAPDVCPQRLDPQHKPVPLARDLFLAGWYPQGDQDWALGRMKRNLSCLECRCFRHPGNVGRQFSLPHRWRRWGLDRIPRPHNLWAQHPILNQTWWG